MSGEPFAEGEAAIVHDRQIQWINIIMNTIYEKGTAVSAICTATDITREKTMLLSMEREVTRRTALESTLRGKGYYDLTEDLIIEYDMSRLVAEPLDDLVCYTDAVHAVMEQVPDQKEKKGVEDLFLPKSLTAMFEQGRTDLSYEYRRFMPEGGLAWVNTRILLLRQPGSGHIVAFMYTSDIDDKKVMSQILETITRDEYDYILLIDTKTDNYKRYACSPKWEGFMPECGTNYREDASGYLKKLMPEDAFADRMRQRSRESICERLENETFCEFTTSFTSKAGENQTKKIRYSYLDQGSTHMLVTCSDITVSMEVEKKQKELLEDALLAAKQASQAKSDFLSRMSHEIRTPMNAILGICTLAAQAGGQEEEVQDCIGKIGISGRYLLSLINDILDMSRIESGKMLLHNMKFSFLELISSINAVIVPQIE